MRVNCPTYGVISFDQPPTPDNLVTAKTFKIARFALIALLLISRNVVADSPVLGAVDARFELVNVAGDVVRETDFVGRNVLLAFGFTRCAHICPMIAANMASAIRAATVDAVGIFVSVDTERDTPTITHHYAQGFDNSMIGLGGSYEQLAEAAKNFSVTFVVTKSQDNYTVQHTPSIFLIGPDGQLIDVFAMNTRSSVIAAAMK